MLTRNREEEGQQLFKRRDQKLETPCRDGKRRLSLGTERTIPVQLEVLEICI